MELKDTLRRIGDETRAHLLEWSADFTDAEALAPAGDPTAPNPLAWQLGHVAATEDAVALLFATDPGAVPLVPEALSAACLTGAPAPGAATAFPSLAELRALLERTHARLVAMLDAASPADLDRPPREPHPFFTSFGQAVYEIALNENYHVGQVGALRKRLGKPRVA